MTVRPADRSKMRERLAAYIRSNRIRRSSSPDVVFGVLLAAEGHLELSELLSLARRKGLGEATVYRALKVFQEAGLVSRIERSPGHSYYEVSRHHHDHLICSGCGGIIEFHSPVIEKTQEAI